MLHLIGRPNKVTLLCLHHGACAVRWKLWQKQDFWTKRAYRSALLPIVVVNIDVSSRHIQNPDAKGTRESPRTDKIDVAFLFVMWCTYLPILKRSCHFVISKRLLSTRRSQLQSHFGGDKRFEIL